MRSLHTGYHQQLTHA